MSTSDIASRLRITDIIDAIKNQQLSYVEIVAIQIAATLIPQKPSNEKPSESELERLKRFVELQPNQTQASYTAVAKALAGTSIRVSLIAIDDHRYQIGESLKVYAYACKDEAMCKLLCEGDGNAEATVVKTYGT